MPYLCGEKSVSFDNDSLSFLTLIPSPSVGSEFGIEYDHTKGIAGDYTVAYTVTFRYDDYGQYNFYELKDTFNFVVEDTLGVGNEFEDCEILEIFEVHCDTNTSDWVLDLRWNVTQFEDTPAEEIDVKLDKAKEFISF